MKEINHHPSTRNKVIYRINFNWGSCILSESSLRVKFNISNSLRVERNLVDLLEYVWIADWLIQHNSYNNFILKFEKLLHNELMSLNVDYLKHRMRLLSIELNLHHTKHQLATQIIDCFKERICFGNKHILNNLLIDILKWSSGHLSVLFQNYQFLEFDEHVNINTYAGNSLLHFACKLGFNNYASLLVTRYHYNIYERNKEHLSPIEIVHNSCNEQLTLTLLKNFTYKSNCAILRKEIVNNFLIKQFDSFASSSLPSLINKIPILEILVNKKAFFYDSKADYKNSPFIRAINSLALLHHRQLSKEDMGKFIMILKSCIENRSKSTITYELHPQEINITLNICFNNLDKNPLWLDIAKTIIVKNPIDFNSDLNLKYLDCKNFSLDRIKDPKLRQASITCLAIGSMLRFRVENDTLEFMLEMIKNAGKQEPKIDGKMSIFLNSSSGIVFKRILLDKFNLSIENYFNMVHNGNFINAVKDMEELKSIKSSYVRLLPLDIIKSVSFYKASSESKFVQRILNDQCIIYNNNSISK